MVEVEDTVGVPLLGGKLSRVRAPFPNWPTPAANRSDRDCARYTELSPTKDSG